MTRSLPKMFLAKKLDKLWFMVWTASRLQEDCLPKTCLPITYRIGKEEFAKFRQSYAQENTHCYLLTETIQ